MLRVVTWQHYPKKLGQRAGVRGPFLNAAIFESPPPPANWPPSPPKRRRGSVSLGTKLDGNSPSSPQFATARPSRRDCVFFVVPTSVGNVDQIFDPMPAKASTTRQLPNAHCLLPTCSSTKHQALRTCDLTCVSTKHQAPAIRPAICCVSTKHLLSPASRAIKQIMTIRILSGIPEIGA